MNNPKADRLQREGYATLPALIVEAKNVSGGSVMVQGLLPYSERGPKVFLPTGVVGNLDECCESVGCVIDLAVLATYVDGNKHLVPSVYKDDVKHFGLTC